MADLDRVGGVPVLMKELLDAGLLHGDAMTVTGKTVAENLAELSPPAVDGDVVRPRGEPIHPFGGIAILRGSLAPDGSVGKIVGMEGKTFTGVARVFDSEEEAFEAVTGGSIVAGDVIVIRYEGPRGGPGMREMLAVTGGDHGRRAGTGRDAGHRRAVQRRDARVLDRAHRAEAAVGGPIALVRDGDTITLDVDARRLDLEVEEDELERRRDGWKAPQPRYEHGALAKYAKLVASASRGAICG